MATREINQITNAHKDAWHSVSQDTSQDSSQDMDFVFETPAKDAWKKATFFSKLFFRYNSFLYTHKPENHKPINSHKPYNAAYCISPAAPHMLHACRL